MNRLKGHIKKIESTENLSIIWVSLSTSEKAILLKSIVVKSPERVSSFQKEQAVELLFKETEVILGLEDNASISIENKIKGTIQRIAHGKLLSKIVIDTKVGEISSVLPTSSVELLGLNEGLSIIALVKMNEIMLSI